MRNTISNDAGRIEQLDDEVVDYDYQRILGSDHRDGPSQCAQLNELKTRGITYLPEKTKSRIFIIILISAFSLFSVGIISAFIQNWASKKVSEANSVKPAVQSTVPYGQLRKLIAGAGLADRKAINVDIADVLKPDSPGADDGVVQAYKEVLKNKTPEGWVQMPLPGQPFPEAPTYKVVSVGSDKIMFVAITVQKPRMYEDSIWLGVVHIKNGKPEVCNFAASELLGMPLIVKAPRSYVTCEVNEKMIPRAFSAAFGTSILEN